VAAAVAAAVKVDPNQAAIQAAAHAAAQAAMASASMYGGMGGNMMGGGLITSPGMPTPGIQVGAGMESIVIDCPQTLVGRIIGKGGETIRDLQMRSGCNIQIDQNFPEGQARKISVQGAPQNVEVAKQLIHNVFNSGPQGTLSMMGIAPIRGLPTDNSPTVTTIVDCPQAVVGKVIGKGGETIKLLQMSSGCRIQIDQNYPEGMPRKITIQGPQAQVTNAIAMVHAKINEGGSGSLLDGKPSVVIDCPKVKKRKKSISVCVKSSSIFKFKFTPISPLHSFSVL
jgi:rRNA processing protein Krr1/Pno1